MNSIKKELISGAAFTAIAKYSGLFAQLFITAVLARLISPSDFGVVAIATVFIAFFNILSDIGIGPAIIQKKDLDDDDLNNIFSLTLYLGVFLSVVFFACSWPLSAFYSSEKLRGVCQLLGIPILFSSLNIVSNGLLLRDKQFKYIAIRTLLSQVVSGGLAVICAFAGWGVYALLVNPILSSIIIFVLSYKAKPLKFKVKLQISSIKKIFTYSSFQFLFNIVNYFSRNLDKLLIGKFIGMVPLGYYDKSYRLMMLPLQNIIFVINPVFQPIFSEYQNDIEKLRDYYLKILKMLMWIAFPLTVIVFFISKELIFVFFGSQWGAAVPVFRILSVTICLQVLISTTGAIYQSVNATKELFVSGCWGAFLLVMGFAIPIFLYGTIEAVAVGYVVSQLLNFIQCFYLLFDKIRYSLFDFLKALSHPLLVSLLVFGFAMVLFSYVTIEENLISLIFKTAILTSVFLLYLFYKRIIDFQSVIKLIRKK